MLASRLKFRPHPVMAGILGLILVEVGILIFARFQPQPSLPPAANNNISLRAYAEEIINKCASEPYRPSCYDKEVPKLMDIISMEEAFQVTRIVQDEDSSYRYCHVLGHELSAREIDKDPSKWKDVVSRCPSGMCSNGCIHGGFQERFRAESFTDAQIETLKPDLATICEKRPAWNPTGLEQASCYHAVGHLIMYLTSADIKKSVVLCKEVAAKADGRDFSQLCLDGSFMQIFQPLEPEDFALIKGREVAKDQLASFCAGFDQSPRVSCWTEGWPLFFQELQQPEGLVAHCAAAQDAFRDRCYSALIYVLTAQFQFDSEKIRSYCAGLPEIWRGRCFANAASRFIETDYRNINKSVALCNSAKIFGQDEACFDELLIYSTYNFQVGSEYFLALCRSMPEPWSGKCLRGEKPSTPSGRSHK